MAKKRVALLNIIRVTKNVQASLQTVLPFFSDGLLSFNAIKEISFHSFNNQLIFNKYMYGAISHKSEGIS